MTSPLCYRFVQRLHLLCKAPSLDTQCNFRRERRLWASEWCLAAMPTPPPSIGIQWQLNFLVAIALVIANCIATTSSTTTTNSTSSSRLTSSSSPRRIAKQPIFWTYVGTSSKRPCVPTTVPYCNEIEKVKGTFIPFTINDNIWISCHSAYRIYYRRNRRNWHGLRQNFEFSRHISVITCLFFAPQKIAPIPLHVFQALL